MLIEYLAPTCGLLEGDGDAVAGTDELVYLDLWPPWWFVTWALAAGIALVPNRSQSAAVIATGRAWTHRLYPNHDPPLRTTELILKGRVFGIIPQICSIGERGAWDVDITMVTLRTNQNTAALALFGSFGCGNWALKNGLSMLHVSSKLIDCTLHILLLTSSTFLP